MASDISPLRKVWHGGGGIDIKSKLGGGQSSPRIVMIFPGIFTLHAQFSDVISFKVYLYYYQLDYFITQGFPKLVHFFTGTVGLLFRLYKILINCN